MTRKQISKDLGGEDSTIKRHRDKKLYGSIKREDNNGKKNPKKPSLVSDKAKAGGGLENRSGMKDFIKLL